MEINFKFNLEDKVTIKYEGEYSKTVYTIIGRRYYQKIGGYEIKKYECFGGVHCKADIDEKMLEKYEEKSKDKKD